MPDTPAPRTAPTREIGYAVAASSWWTTDTETTRELQWPLSVGVYDQMRRTDAQAASVLRAVSLPVRRTRWSIDPAGARDEVTELVAGDLGLPIVGSSAGENVAPRTRDRFSWDEHLATVLLMLAYGHIFFEQVYRIDELGRARLRKLAPRMPPTLTAINVAQDGGLESIEQYAPLTRIGVGKVEIPVTRLVAYVHDREAGNWLGSSLLRPAYKHWLIKDRMLRVQAQTAERNGMGVPLYTAQPGATEADLERGKELAAAWRSGDAAGAAIPNGATLRLLGVEGTLPDVDPIIRYHDEQIARAVLAHFLNLGTQTGSWALGSTFADFFTLSLQTLATQVADTVNRHVIEDLVDLNYGEAEPVPRLVFEEIGSRHTATADAIRMLVQSGALFMDRATEEHLRQQYGLPPKGAPSPGSGATSEPPEPALPPPVSTP